MVSVGGCPVFPVRTGTTILAEVLQTVAFDTLSDSQFLSLATSLQPLWGEVSCFVAFNTHFHAVVWYETRWCGVWNVPGAGGAGVRGTVGARQQSNAI